MMAEPISSVLLVDYESLQRSLAAVAGETRLADRAAAWLGAIESGRLIGPEGVRRHISVKRCYAGPSVRGKQRDGLAAAGFDVVDIADGAARGSADLHMAMDTIEALTRPEGYREFILLSTAMDLAPLLTRLKASNRRTTIFVDATTPENDKSLADAHLAGADFARFLTGAETALAEIRAPSRGGERAEIEAFARRIHAATSIPLFSPKTFAELFRQLTEEIAANGYHFQTTAKNVADRMMASGRTVTRRQVVFIVKGLALKGHVFSTGDTPEGLAEVFREQARYLITNAGIGLAPREEQLLSAWFSSHSAPIVPRLAPPSQSPASTSAPSAETKAKIAETIEREVAKAVTRPPEKAKPPARPTASAKPPTVKPVDLPKLGAARSHPMKSSPSPAAREEAKAVIAARIAASAKFKNGSRPAVPAKPAPPAAALPAPPAPPTAAEAAADTAPTQASSAALENSILAAIAEAVDVLVEDSNDDERPPREPPARQRQSGTARLPERSSPAPRPRQVPEPEPEPEPEENTDSNDIGDQIQRIIASYNRNRTEE
jgi:hypothetical protein